MVSCPLLTPLTFLYADTSEMCSETGVRGLGSVRRFAFGTLYCPEFTLRDWQRCQCAARRCRSAALRCEKLCFDHGCALGAPDVPVGPSLLDARPKGVASKGSRVQRKGWGVKRGRETLVSLPLLSLPGDPGIPCRRAAALPLRRGYGVPPLRRETPAIPRRRAAAMHTPCHGEHPRPGRAFLASSGEPLYRRRVYRQQTVKIFQRMPHSCEYHCAASGTATPPRRYSAASAHFARYDRASSNQTSCSVPPRQKL